MSIRQHSTRLFIALLLIIIGPTDLIHAEESESITIEMNCPVESKTYDGPISFDAKIKGGNTDKQMTLTVECFGSTRYANLLASMSLLGQMPDHHVTFDAWPVKEGPHKLQVTVTMEDSDQPLAQKEINFTVKKKDIPQEEHLRVRKMIYSMNHSLVNREKELSLAQSAARIDPQAIAKRNELANKVHSLRLLELNDRVRAFITLSDLYAAQFEYEKALKAAQTGFEIYKEDINHCAIHPLHPDKVNLYTPEGLAYAPACYKGLAVLYTRLGDLEKTIEWWQKVSDWYKQQMKDRNDLSDEMRKQCLKLAREPYFKMADAHILLKIDREAAKKCRDAAESVN